MGRKPSGKRGAIRLYLAAGMMAALGLFLSINAGAQNSDDATGQHRLIDCLGPGVPPREALACVEQLGNGVAADTELSRNGSFLQPFPVQGDNVQNGLLFFKPFSCLILSLNLLS